MMSKLLFQIKQVIMKKQCNKEKIGIQYHRKKLWLFYNGNNFKHFRMRINLSNKHIRRIDARRYLSLNAVNTFSPVTKTKFSICSFLLSNNLLVFIGLIKE
jgi:hypothetical protein